MEIIFKIISVTLQSIMTSYIITIISKSLKKCKYNKLKIGIFFTTTTIASIATMNFKETNVILSIAILGITVLANLLLNLKVKFLYAISIELGTFLLFSIVEVLITFLLLSITHLSAQDVSLNPFYSFLFALIHLGCILLILKLTKYIAKNKSNFEHIIKNITSISLIALLIALILGIVPQLLLFAIFKYDYSPSFILINSIQMLLICIIIFTMLKKTIEKDKAESDLIASKFNNKTMSNMVEGLVTLKHDLNNIISTLSSYSKAKKYTQLDNYINKIAKEFKVVNDLTLINQEVFNEPGIYGIVGAKYLLITNSNINMDLYIFTDVKSINFPAPELSRILGILLDNAFEATKKCKNPYVRLEMKYDERKYADIIKVINTYDTDIEIDTEKIFEKGFSSKKKKSGIGLWEVSKIISEIPHSEINTSIQNNKFIQTITIEK